MVWTNKGHEFDKIAIEICNNLHEYVIWGAGTFGRVFYDEFKDEIDIVGIVDSKKAGERWTDGLPVCSPSILDVSDGKVVLVSTGWTNQVFSELDQKGYQRYVNYFHIDEFLTIYKMYKNNKLVANFLGITVTDYCTLSCKKCWEFTPYISDKIHQPISRIEEQLDCFFNVVDELSVLAVSGGDSMVHPRFEEILELIGEKYYGSKVHHIEIYSNAVVYPSEHCLRLFKKYDIIYRFTDYGDQTRGRQKPEQLVALLESWGIKYDRAKFDKWVDNGYIQESNGVPENQLAEFYSACDKRSCQRIDGTRFFYCGTAISAERIGYCKADRRDYYDLSNPNINRKELMEFMLGFNERGYIEYCKKCNGSPNINAHYIVSGEQVIQSNPPCT